MSKKGVAETVGAHVMLSSPEAELWRRVAHGELSSEQAAAELLEGRKDLGESEREAIERAKAVFAPLSPERRQAQLEALVARQRAEEQESGATVVPMRSRRSRGWFVGALAIAASIGLTLWLASPRPRGDEMAFSGGYAIVIDNASAGMRGTEPQAEIARFLLDDEIKLRLVPDEAVEGSVGVVAFVLDDSGRARSVELAPRVHPRGVLEIDVAVKDLGLDEGRWELVFAIGRARALPGSWEELEEGSAPSVGYEVVRTKVEIVSRL